MDAGQWRPSSQVWWVQLVCGAMQRGGRRPPLPAALGHPGRSDRTDLILSLYLSQLVPRQFLSTTQHFLPCLCVQAAWCRTEYADATCAPLPTCLRKRQLGGCSGCVYEANSTAGTPRRRLSSPFGLSFSTLAGSRQDTGRGQHTSFVGARLEISHRDSAGGAGATLWWGARCDLVAGAG